MNEPTTSRFSNVGEVEQISEYRRFNLLALIAAALGVGSFSVLISSFLIVLPLLGIFIGACGLVSYRRQEDLGGRIPAWIGIALSLFFISWSASQFTFHRCVLYSEAYVVGKDWLQLVVKNEKEIAHQGMMSITRRQASGLSVDEYYEMDEEARTGMEEVFSASPLSELVTFGENTKIKLLKNMSIRHDLGSTYLEQLVRVTPDQGEPINLKMSTIRKHNEALGKPSWIVNGAESIEGESVNVFDSMSSVITRMVAG